MKNGTLINIDKKPEMIFILCLVYALHMVEEFSCGFVEWADRYFGKFNWAQNLIGNFMFFVALAYGCYLYYKDPKRNLWAGVSGSMWVLSNAFLHISTNILGREYSPGVVTAAALYVPGGLYFISQWGRKGLLTWKILIMGFVIGAMIFMLIPTYVRAIILRARLAKIFHLVK
ncbi:MAG TPA: HXXEE domain-containing protein [Desulfomonilia bacterium]